MITAYLSFVMITPIFYLSDLCLLCDVKFASVSNTPRLAYGFTV